MNLDDIIKVRVGTILRFSNNTKWIVVGKDIYSDDLSSVLVVEKNDISNGFLPISLVESNALIDYQLTEVDMTKYELCGLHFDNSWNWLNYIIDISKLDEHKLIEIYLHGCRKCLVERISNKYYLYDYIKDNNDYYLVNKRDFVIRDRCFFGKKFRSLRYSYLDTVFEMNQLDSIRNKALMYRHKIRELVKLAKQMGTNKDFALITLYNKDKKTLYSEVRDYIFKKVNISDTYRYKAENICISNTFRVKYDTDYNYKKYLEKIDDYIIELCNYITRELGRNANKKLSTVAKELIKSGIKISEYDESISYEEFFDTDKYYPFSIIDVFREFDNLV